MGRRSSRAAARKASAALESTPKGFAETEDEPMVDAAAADEGSEHEEPPAQDDDDDDQEETKVASDHQEAAAREGEEEGDEAKEPSPPPQPVIRRKRLGRPPKNKPPDWDPMITVTEDTPRRRGRGGWRGRGGRKGGPAAPKAEQVIDAEGTVAEIVNDECVLPEDPEGETKVDKLGNLEGGRDYRCRTFTVLGRGNRLYMLSTEPARCVGFRDSYLFFTKHRKLHKIIVDDDEKRDMIERDIIPHSYKGRSIGVVTARSVFREFGARIIIGGKRIIDDYNVAQLREEGAVEGQLADPDDHFVPGEYNKNQYVAWHGASAVYHTNVPSVPVPNGKPEYRKRKVNVNDQNWMLEHAREASIFNAGINAIRKFNNAGVYDIHTNMIQYPATMQPTRVRIEQVSPDEEAASKGSAKFPPVPLRMARNFLVMDTYCEGAPRNGASVRPSNETPAEFVASFNGLVSVSDEIKDLLPAECRKAFDEALEAEVEFQSRWGTEKEKMSRRDPIIDKAIVPYSMS
ncbi:chromatin structure-remodeling complex subunit RSC7 [Metarhizium acridum]|uniref:chromatin structure-remodeling complex subunit RSC7 n=1 Tax=Metarhizium acridum TaxID=92637 RepID=UPI001C6B6860|nr:chromatin structure-remodeling complex subunit RSC7 [Metarhizium acridum]